MPQNPPTSAVQTSFHRLNRETGLVEVIDCETGQVIAVQNSPSLPPSATFIDYMHNGRTIRVQTGLTHQASNIRDTYVYSTGLGEIIQQYLIDGTTLSGISLMPNMPDRITITRWRRMYPEFDELIRSAKKYRAEYLRDEVVNEARDSTNLHKDRVPAKKLHIDTLKWAAEKDDPESFGNKVKVDGTLGVVQLVVETGIRRDSDPAVTKTVENVSDITAHTTDITEDDNDSNTSDSDSND